MTHDELVDRLLNLERRIEALEDALRIPRPTTEHCDGHHSGRPCADPRCWVLRRHREQQEEQ